MQADLSKPRRLERTVITRIARNKKPTLILELSALRIPRGSQIPEPIVREAAASVASTASGLIVEQIKPQLGLRRHSILLVAEVPPVVRRISADARALVV